MNEIKLDTELFPKLHDAVRAHWSPVFFEPISGSCERLVVGVAAVNATGFHVEMANQLHRLTCFYGDDATGAINAVNIAGNYLKSDLANRSLDALHQPDPAVTGITFGDLREAEGSSLQMIAQSWMAALSSLYLSPDTELLSEVRPEAMSASPSNGSTPGGDRLPFLVCDYVKSENDRFTNYFSRDLRERKRRRTKGTSHKILIDFSGSKLVANFGTLKAGALTGSINHIKRRLWDLKVERDKEAMSSISRKHEMILQRPSANDPQVTDKQQANLEEAFQSLEDQADQEKLRLRGLDSVPKIGQHILATETA